MPQFAFFFLTILPWLNPFAPGPSPAIAPWLFTVGCSGLLTALTVLDSRRLAIHDKGFALTYTWPIALAWLAAGLLSSAIGLLQYFGAAGALSPWANQTSFGEAYANLRQPNQFATLTNIALAALIWVGFAWRPSADGAKRKRLCLVLGWVAGALLALGNAVSSSRTGLVQLVLLCGLWLMWGGWQRVWLRNLLLAVLLIYTTAMFAAPFAAGLDMTSHAALLRMGNDAPCSSRLVLWSNVLHLIGQKPWLGWGWGNLDYAHFITLYNEPRFCDILDNAHNLPLHLAVELGVPAAVGGCGAFAVWVAKQKPWLERDPGRQLAWSVLATRVDTCTLVTDEAIADAQRWLWRDLRLVAEPGGATSLAALMSGAWSPPPGSSVGVIVCGGNADSLPE